MRMLAIPIFGRTIMKSIIGFLRYDGEITVGGLPNKTTDARRLLGYIPEMPSLYPNLTASEHMEFLARAYSLTNYKQRMDELFERFELNDKRKKFGDELSKGMQQKLNICLGLLPEPKMLLLDEPMIGLDPHAIKQLKSVIEQMRNEGKTLLVSTHIIDSVDMLWDRTIIMQDGQIRTNVTREELDSDGRTLEQLFFDVTEGIGRDAMSHSEAGASQGGLFYESIRILRMAHLCKPASKAVQNLGADLLGCVRPDWSFDWFWRGDVG